MSSHLTFVAERVKEAQWNLMLICRLRQVDVKAEHFERQVTRAEQERDDWEQKHSVSSPRSPHIG